jgi:hypothetical protein
MKAGLVDLKPIYQVVRANPTCYDFSERPKIPRYRKQAEQVVAQVPDLKGVYLWGKYDRRCYWSSIYFGLAGLGKTKYRLKSRLLEELMDEKSCFWRICRSKKHIIKARDDGQKARRRAVRKRGATHIIWVATPKLRKRQVREVEADLIEALNPVANVVRATPPSHIQKDATAIYNAFRKVIHTHRGDACPVYVK